MLRTQSSQARGKGEGTLQSGISSGTTVLSRGTGRSVSPGDKGAVQSFTQLRWAAGSVEHSSSNPFLEESSFLFSFQPQFPCGPNPFLRTMVEGTRPSRRNPSIPGSWERVTADRTSPPAWISNPFPVSVSCHCSFNSPSHRPPGFARTSCPPKLHLLRGCTEPGWAGQGRAEPKRAGRWRQQLP